MPERNKFYKVTWTIELKAISPEAAAEIAREIQLDGESTATVFEVEEIDAEGGYSPSRIIDTERGS